ncbi:MAG: hypothetical protein CSA20_09225 [Deltaproteobacteria bacterium]|nr:MAG: hypothetical protein CSA20_09225 [Deltaproteobacteria bacterium]
MNKTSPRFALYRLCFFLLMCLALCSCDKEKAEPARKGMVAPNPGALYLENDQPVTLDKYLGNPLVVIFFSNSCCADELEKMEELVHSSEKDAFSVLGINVGDRREAVARLGKEKKVSFPLAYDPILTSKHRFRLMAIPTIFVIGRDGKIIGRIIGKVTYEQLSSKVKEMLHEQEK